MSSNKWISKEGVIALQTVILHPVENTLDVHRCVYVVFMFIHVCVHVNSMGAPGAFVCCCLPCLFRQSLFTEPEAH